MAGRAACVGCRGGAVRAGLQVIGLRLVNGPDQATIRDTDGTTATVPLHTVPKALVLAYLASQGFTRPAASRGVLGDLGDDLSALIDDIQAEGREWFFERIRDLSDLGVRWQSAATQADKIPDAQAAQAARSQAVTVAKIRDDLYWVVDTYLGGVEALPNVVPARGVPVPRPPRPNVGAAQVIIAAVGIISGAALLAYIASQVRDHAEFKARLDAAVNSDHPEDFIGPPDQGTPGIVDQIKSGVGTVVTIGILGALAVAFWPELKSGAQRAAARAKAAA